METDTWAVLVGGVYDGVRMALRGEPGEVIIPWKDDKIEWSEEHAMAIPLEVDWVELRYERVAEMAENGDVQYVYVE